MNNIKFGELVESTVIGASCNVALKSREVFIGGVIGI